MPSNGWRTGRKTPVMPRSSPTPNRTANCGDARQGFWRACRGQGPVALRHHSPAWPASPIHGTCPPRCPPAPRRSPSSRCSCDGHSRAHSHPPGRTIRDLNATAQREAGSMASLRPIGKSAEATAGKACGRPSVLRTHGRPRSGRRAFGGRGGVRPAWEGVTRDSIVTGGMVPRRPTTPPQSGPPLLGKEGSAFSGVGSQESGVGRKIRPIW